MTVRLMDGTTKRMDELTKQDWVLSVHKDRLEYVPVKFWLHRVPTQEAEFNVFDTDDDKTKLTDKHYIYKIASITKEAVTADQLHADDCLYTLVENGKAMREVRIVRADKVTQTGIYAPMTSTGRIIVNNVYASCHNIIQANSVQSFFWIFEKANDIYYRLFTSDTDEIVETPTGLSTILVIFELVLPKKSIFDSPCDCGHN